MGTKAARCVLAAMMVVAVCGHAFAGGTGEATTQTEGDGPISLTWWVSMNPNAVKILTNYGENEVYKLIEDRFNVDIDFVHPAQGQEREQYNLMIASNDITDLIQGASSYKGGGDKAIDDGVYLRLNELIEEHAPAFASLRETYPEIARQTITDAGNIPWFPMISLPLQGPWFGPIMRADWLDDLGLELPTTIEDWHEVLLSFKEEKAADAPLLFRVDWSWKYGAFSGAWGVRNGFVNREGTVKYGPIEPGWKSFLETFHQWYEDGLIDQDFATRDSKSRQALITNHEAGSWPGAYGIDIVTMLGLMEDDPSFALTATAYPSLEEGQPVHIGQRNNYAMGEETAITSVCEFPERAAEILNFGYTEEGTLMYNCGIEGVSYQMIDGKPEFTELMLDNPDGYDFFTLSYKYKVQNGPFIQNYLMAEPDLGPEVRFAQQVWAEATGNYMMPPTTKTAEEGRRHGAIMSEVSTYVDEMFLKFFMGIEPLSKFDEYVDQIKRMGIDEAIAIEQAALDRYLSR